jgi:hypothetical protein
MLTPLSLSKDTKLCRISRGVQSALFSPGNSVDRLGQATMEAFE